MFAGALSVGAELLLLVNALGLLGAAAFSVPLTGSFADLGPAELFSILVMGSASPSTGDSES